MRAIRTGLNAAGIPVESSKGEASAGQEEINVRYADALAAADAHVVVKNAVKEIAWAKGRAVTFMAKVAQGAAGSSCHIHQSLQGAGGHAAFHDPAAPHGMSGMMRAWLAGLLANAAETTYFLAPNVNSYKRFVAGTFAPTRTVWSIDNRTAGFRLVGADSPAVRVECRIGGADLNPYLGFAAQLAAGIAGIEARARARPRVPRRRLPGRPPARDPEDAARGHRGAAPLGDAARRLRRRGRRALRPRRPLGAGGMRPPGDRLGNRPRLRTGLREEPMPEITCISPVDGSVYATRPVEPADSARRKLAAARDAQKAWAARPLAERTRLVEEGVARLDRVNADLVTELAWQMGRPVRYGGEMGGVRERTAYMAGIAERALAPEVIEDSEKFRRVLARGPLGLVFVIAPWNYPFLTAINTIVPALIAGNAVVLKHASQTPLAGERLAQAFAHLPEGLFTNLFLDHATTAELIAGRAFDFMNFTGSVRGGQEIERAAAGTFTGLGLELGGKDPGYVRADATSTPPSRC